MTSLSVLRHPWLGVEIRHLAALEAIERTGSFRGAADELGYVPSAVSQQIAGLERTVGARLVDRSRGQRSVTVTRAGGLLVEHGRRILSELQAARVDLSGAQIGGERVLTVGIGPGIAARLLPRLAQMAGERLTGPHVRFVEPADEDVLPVLVATGDLDLAIAAGPAPDSRLTVLPVVSDPWVLLSPSDCLVGRRGVLRTPAELEGRMLLAPPRSALFDRVQIQLEAAGIPVAGAVRTPVGPAMEASVASGAAFAIMPAMAADPLSTSTAIVSLEEVVAPRELGLLWNARRRVTDEIEPLRDAIVGILSPLDAEPALAAQNS